jgi:hypothetical protein
MRQIEPRFAATTFSHPHAPFGGKYIPRKNIRATMWLIL